MTEEDTSKFRTKRRSIGSDGELKWGGDGGEEWSEAVESSECVTVRDDGTISSGSEIPDSEVYLHDDWGDNKLTDRDDSGTTTYNGVEGVYRPEWTIDNGSPSASNSSLTFESGDQVRADINLNFNETITWTYDLDYNGHSSTLAQMQITHFAGNTNSQPIGDFGGGAYGNGYFSMLGQDNDLYRLYRTDENGNTSSQLIDLIGSVSPETWNTLTVEREPNGDWYVYADGSQIGSANDSTHTDALVTGFSSRDGGSDITDVFNMKVS